MPSLEPAARRAVILLAAFAAALGVACARKPVPLDASSPEYAEAVSAFNVGVAGLEVGDDAHAAAGLARLTELAPAEPAGWADLGLLSLRHRDYDASAAQFAKARELAPDNARIHAMSGLLESARGRSPEAIAAFQKAIALDPDDLEARYSLAKELSRQGDDAAALGQFQALVERRPDNLEALIEQARLAAKLGDTAAFARAEDRIGQLSAAWPPDVQERVRALQAGGADPRAAASSVAFLRNAMVQLPEYRRCSAEVLCPPGVIAHPISRFLWLPQPEPSPAPPDDGLRFSPHAIDAAPPGAFSVLRTAVLTTDGAPVPVLARDAVVRVGKDAQLVFPGAPTPDGMCAFDADFDFRTDFALAGAKGFRLYIQNPAGAFVDATPRTKLAGDIVNGAYAGAWAVDLDLDGDLDLVLARVTGPPALLRNNGDGSWLATDVFEDVVDVRSFVWADLDNDGDADAVLLDAQGALHVFANERLGQFAPRAAPADAVAAIATGDMAGRGQLELVALETNGTLLRLADRRDLAQWTMEPIGNFPAAVATGDARLFVADVDNNGAVDIVAAGALGGLVWLGSGGGGFAPLDVVPRERITAAADVDGDGRLDLAGLSADGRPFVATNTGSRDYQWMELRPRARDMQGDRRVNSFGIGGTAEVRAGTLYQKAPIAGPIVHIGLGKRHDADVARITWPNGALQAEFDLKVDTPVVFDQRLEGSCPWLFAFDGTRMNFVTDLIWRSPLGLRINAQDTGRVMQTEDWVKIRGDQLAAVGGQYDLRVSAELWETHFFDHLSLLSVDHPAGTEIWVDERFSIPPPELKVVTTGPLHPVTAAVDDHGADVSATVRAVDGNYLDTCGRGPYQGITRDHFVEIDLSDAPASGPLYVIANGWIHPTDSSINVAVSQGSTPAPQPLSLEVPDGRGGWTVARSNLGFPAGKNKTIVLPLDGVFLPGTERRLRLRTNLEVFWDAIGWAVAADDAGVRTARLDASTADLTYRGFSVVRQANASSPELPDYEHIAGTTARWADLAGFYTRFGDVRELVARVDDRYVIMNAGDELAIRFAAPPPPPAGTVRDFVVVADGWVKDGNFNTTFSKTVLPLPLHDQPDYTTAPGRLEDDPAFRRHPDDWMTYHTRYVAPDALHDAMSGRFTDLPAGKRQ